MGEGWVRDGGGRDGGRGKGNLYFLNLLTPHYMNYKVLRSLGGIHLSNNEDFSKRTCLFFAKKNTPYLHSICVGQSSQKPKGGPLDEKYFFLQNRYWISTRIGSKFRLFFADL